MEFPNQIIAPFASEILYCIFLTKVWFVHNPVWHLLNYGVNEYWSSLRTLKLATTLSFKICRNILKNTFKCIFHHLSHFLRLYGIPLYCDVPPIQISKKKNQRHFYDFFFVLCAGVFILFTFPKKLKSIFRSNIIRFISFTPGIFWLWYTFIWH